MRDSADRPRPINPSNRRRCHRRGLVCKPCSRYPLLDRAVNSTSFEVFFGCFIIINCIFIGLAADSVPGKGYDMPPMPARLHGFCRSDHSTAEHVFTAVFFIEWILRVTSGGWVWMFDSKLLLPLVMTMLLPLSSVYNFLDFLLVFITGVMANWFLDPLGVDVSLLRKLTVLRALRLVEALVTVPSMVVVGTISSSRSPYPNVQGNVVALRRLPRQCSPYTMDPHHNHCTPIHVLRMGVGYTIYLYVYSFLSVLRSLATMLELLQIPSLPLYSLRSIKACSLYCKYLPV